MAFPYFSDGEVMQFAQQITDLFEATGFVITGNDVLRLMAYQEAGLKVVAHQDPSSEQLAATIQSAFSQAGIAIRLEKGDTKDDRSVTLYVGARF